MSLRKVKGCDPSTRSVFGGDLRGPTEMSLDRACILKLIFLQKIYILYENAGSERA